MRINDSKANPLSVNDILNGEIISKEKNITSIRFLNAKTLNFNSKDIVGEVSDKVSFKIVAKENNCIKLKQILNSEFKDTAKNLQESKNIENLFKKSEFISDSKDEQALANFKRRLSKLSGDANVINELVAAGISLDKINLSLLMEAFKKLDDHKKTIPKDNIIEEIPAANLKYVNKNLEIIKASANPSDKTVLNIIKDNMIISPENLIIYKNTDFSNFNSDILFENAEDEIKKLFSEQEIDASSENIEIAKAFINNGIEINSENLEKYKFLKNIISDPKAVATATIDAISAGEKPLSVDLFKLDKQYRIFIENTNAAEKLKDIKPDNIQNLLDNDIELTPENLFRYSEKNNNIFADAIELKKNIAEIQLKLTTESCYRLAGKNININTEPVKKILNELNSLLYENNLKFMNTETNAVNIEKISTAFNNIENLKFITPPVYKDIIFKNIDFNLDGINKSILKNYENFQTKVSANFGDKLTQADIAGFLKSMNYSNSEENRAAFQILYKNNLEITPELLDKTKVVDYKLNQIKSELKPNIVAQMLKENVDPSRLSIDEMLDYIDMFKEIYGTTEKDSLEEALMKFEKEDSRDAIYSVYRMLHTICKNNSKAIGFMVNNGSELTLNSLFQAGKYLNGNKDFDFSLDGDFGLLEKINSSEKNIIQNIQNVLEKELNSAGENRQKLQDYFDKNDISVFKIKAAKEILKAEENIIESKIDSSFLYKFEINNFTNFMLENNQNIQFDKLNNDLPVNLLSNLFVHKAKKDDDILSTEKYDFLDADEKSIDFLNTNDLEINKINLKAADDYLNNPEILADSFNALNNKDFISNENILDDSYIFDVYSKIDFPAEDISITERIKNMISLQAGLQEKNIPVTIGNKINNLKMLILNEDFENKDDINVLVAIKSDKLGNLKFKINLKSADNAKTADIKIEADNSLAQKKLERNKDFLYSDDIILNVIYDA